MKLAMEAAKFTPEEANGLRRSMATFRNLGTVGDYGVKFVEGMVRRGYDPEFARRCFKQIEGFGSYGFPESHAVSFAKLVYISAWIKCHYPDVFCAALLNSQPMGFYQPAQLVRDAREHGVEVRGPDVMLSDWDSRLEPLPPPRGRGRGWGALRSEAASCARLSHHVQPARDPHRHPSPRGGGESRSLPVRLGLQTSPWTEGRGDPAADGGPRRRRRQLRGARPPRPAVRRTLELLAEADAFRSLGLDRREALWRDEGAGAGGEGERGGAAAGRAGPRGGAGEAAAHAAAGARGGGLPHHRPLPEGASVPLLPPAAHQPGRRPDRAS